MYHEMLRKIQFCDSDHLYILGDSLSLTNAMRE